MIGSMTGGVEHIVESHHEDQGDPQQQWGMSTTYPVPFLPLPPPPPSLSHFPQSINRICVPHDPH